MDGQKRNFPSILRTGLLILFLLFFPFYSLVSQTRVIASLSSSFPKVGEEVTLTFSFPNNMAFSLLIEESIFPEGVSQTGDPLIIFDEVENQTNIIFKIISYEVGFKEIPSFVFREGEIGEFRSDPINIGFSMNTSDSSILKDSFSFSLLRQEDSILRVNQTTGIALVVKGNTFLRDYDISLFDFVFPPSIRFLEVPLFYDLKSITPLGRGNSEKSLKNWIIFFTEEGLFDNLNLEVNFRDKKYLLPMGSWEILPLEGLIDSCAVGSFDITTGLKKESSYIELTIVLSGEGNFNSLEFPVLNVNQGEIISLVEDNSLRPTDKGFKGSLFRTYTIKPSDTSQVQVWTSPFYYWNSTLDKVEKIDSISFFEKDLKNNNRVSLKEKEKDLEALTLDEISSLKFNFLFSNALWYLIFLPIFIFPSLLIKKGSLRIIAFLLITSFTLILFLVFWVGFKQVGKSQELLVSSQENISWEGSNEALISEINTILYLPTPSYYRANLLYNKAIYLYQLGNIQDSIYYLYLSLKEAPLHIPSQRALFIISQLSGQDNIIDFSYFYWLNYLFISIAITLNLYSLFFFFLKTKRVFRFFSLFFLSFFLVLEVLFFARLLFNLNRPIAVLKGPIIPLLQVPNHFASPWIFIKGGTPIYILDESSSFYRVSLPSGIQAWVEKGKTSNI